MLRPATALLAAALLTGCGGGHPAPRAAERAPALSARVAVSGAVPAARPADFRVPIARYRRHVRRQLGAMLVDVGDLQDAIATGSPARARRAWLAADARFESIGAAYGAFGTLAVRIGGTSAGLPAGERSSRFTGLHRVELALWGRHSLRDARAPARRLARDVRVLRARVATLPIAPLDYALRSHEVLEDSLHLQLGGRASRWSGAALTALQADVAGTRVVLGTLRSLVRRRDPLAAAESERALERLDATLREVRAGHATLPRWDAVARVDRERIAGQTALAVERLARIPELIDPRPPRPPVSPFAAGAVR